jgi:DNA invertase Pin-like site-specific DNA recombinase
MIIGYARVSTDGQTLDLQQEKLREAGATTIYSEKMSGAKADNREALIKAISACGAGCTLLVTRLDRLARSTKDLLNILDMLSTNGAKFKSLSDPWADTTTPQGELLITLLAGIATFERHLIRARTGEGRQRARANGVKFGRKAKLTIDQQQMAMQRKANGETTVAIARSLGVSHSTISRL